MVKVQRSEERGRTKIDWLNSYHSFSFGEYYDPGNMGFGPLRVINDDIVAPGAGFPTHPHRDMEIITIVTDGTIEHKDSTGTKGQLKWGEVQKMSAGKGILHSEYNPSNDEYLKLLQIWIIPDVRGLVPSYEEKKFDFDNTKNELILIGSKEKSDDKIFIHQDASLYYGNYEAGNSVEMSINEGYGIYLFVISGELEANGENLSNRDAIMIESEEKISTSIKKDAKFIMFYVKI
ncbi:MAG: pirin family protein [Melioribacteraceae bacterium]|nr:MAG: pirin family protein [Melioribacteraceae bacterium]